MRYAYPCSIVRDEEEARATGREAYIVTFPDVYGANSGAWSWDDAVDMAKDCLEVALGMYVKAREDIPAHQPIGRGPGTDLRRANSRGETRPLHGDA